NTIKIGTMVIREKLASATNVHVIDKLSNVLSILQQEKGEELNKIVSKISQYADNQNAVFGQDELTSIRRWMQTNADDLTKIKKSQTTESTLTVNNDGQRSQPNRRGNLPNWIFSAGKQAQKERATQQEMNKKDDEDTAESKFTMR
ncbi:MAG: hypothetical protein KDH94_05240, partial [Coxiellaceae bacterium]|nr:hypothetical protein [Coxiellaceae bacterium]